MTSTVALIDADIVARKVAHASEQEVNTAFLLGSKLGTFKGKAFHTYLSTREDVVIESEWKVDPEKNCVYPLKQKMQKILDDTGADEYEGYLSPSTCFRNDIYPDYKISRKDKRRPENLDFCKKYLQDEWGVYYPKARIEADDALGIRNTQLKKLGYTPIISSIDKDLRMLPGTHHNPDNETIEEVSEEEGNRRFFAQWLTGDSTDDIPGLYRVGEVKAYKILSECTNEKEMEAKVFETYIEALGKKGKKEKEAIEHAKMIADLIWIMREPDTPYSKHSWS